MAKVERDPKTKEVLLIYNDEPLEEDVPQALGEDGEYRPFGTSGQPYIEGETEVVVLPDYTREEFVEEANARAGGRAGRMWLKDGRVQAEPAGEDPETAIEGALLGMRDSLRERGGGSLTAADIDRAIERERSRERSRGRGKGRG